MPDEGGQAKSEKKSQRKWENEEFDFFFFFITHIMQQPLQVLLQLTEVDAGDEALSRFGQAVSGHLSYLVVDEAEHPVGQRQNTLW